MKLPPLTPEKLETAARKLCKLKGVDPDEMVHDSKLYSAFDQLIAPEFPRWQLEAQKIKGFYDTLEVLMEVLR